MTPIRNLSQTTAACYSFSWSLRKKNENVFMLKHIFQWPSTPKGYGKAAKYDYEFVATCEAKYQNFEYNYISFEMIV